MQQGPRKAYGWRIRGRIEAPQQQREKERAPRFKSIDRKVGFCRRVKRCQAFLEYNPSRWYCKQGARGGSGEGWMLGFEQPKSDLVEDKVQGLWSCHHSLPSPRSG